MLPDSFRSVVPTYLGDLRGASNQTCTRGEYRSHFERYLLLLSIATPRAFTAEPPEIREMTGIHMFVLDFIAAKTSALLGLRGILH